MKLKGKKLLALASIFAGVALIGSTFAAWAITDNAPTKTIKISGEKISASDGTSYVTLEYGEHTSLSDVASLESGTKRYAGKAGLVASYTGATAYNGKLTLAMSQAAREGKRLIDFLKVYVYEGDEEHVPVTYDGSTKVVSAVTGSPVVTLDGTGESPVLSDSEVFAMTSGSEKMVYFVVEMVSAGVDASTLNTVKNDVVTVSVDWDHDLTGQPQANQVTVYYKPTLTEGQSAYCYAWKAKVPNAAYPGVEMTEESDGVFSYVINTDLFDSFILSYGDGTEAGNVKAREADFAVTEVVGTNNYFNGSAWTTRPVADSTLTADYYVVGDMAASNWGCNATYAMTKDATVKDDNNQDTYKVEGLAFAAGQKIKVRNNSNLASEEWFGNVSAVDSDPFTIDYDGNVVVKAAGTYTVRLYKNSNYNNHIVLTKTA